MDGMASACELSINVVMTNKPNTLITGKVTINEGILLIGAAGQLGSGLAAPDTLTFNGGVITVCSMPSMRNRTRISVS